MKQQYVAMPAGILRGALVRLGYQAAVVPEILNLPQCKCCDGSLCISTADPPSHRLVPTEASQRAMMRSLNAVRL